MDGSHCSIHCDHSCNRGCFMDYDFCRRMNFELMKTVNDSKNKNALEECLTDKKVMMNLYPFVETSMAGKSM